MNLKSDERFFDLADSTGCSDNPLARFIGALREGASRVRVKAKQSVLPQQLAMLLAEKYGYELRFSGSVGEVYEALLVKKSQS
ncbi:MAG: hypothetical protein QXM53_10205 [Thermofilaceae archaeon]